jgi:hypothetical protein
MQHLESSATPVLYIGRTVLKSQTSQHTSYCVCRLHRLQSNLQYCVKSNIFEKVHPTTNPHDHAHYTANLTSSCVTRDLVVALYSNQEFSFLHCHWFRPSFCWSPYITSLHTNLYTAPTNQNTVGNKLTNSHTQNTTTLSQIYLN